MVGRLVAALAGVAVLLTPQAAHGASPVAGQLRVAIDTASRDADFSRTAARQEYVILHDWEDAKRRALKAANPKIRVLLYRNLSAMSTADAWGNHSTGITTQEAESHPEWYLLNTSGQRFSFGNYNWLWAADIGNPAYQQRWTENVLSILQRDGWDGVFVDDANATIKYHYSVSAVAKYPSDGAYQAATRSALAVLGPRIQAAGKLVIPNMGAWREYRPVVEDWLQYVSGGMDEMFTKWSNSRGEGYLTGSAWEHQMKEIIATEDRGKAFLAVAHSANTDADAARYGWATVLLAARGNASFALHGDYAEEPWFEEYDYDIGDALGAATESHGVWRRAFERGLVLVNPGTASVSVELGASYSGSGLHGASRAVMGPHSGLILTRDGGAPPVVGPIAPPRPADVHVPTPLPIAPASLTPSPAPVAAAGSDPSPAEPAGTPRRRAVRLRVRCVSARRSCRQRLVLRGRRGGGRRVRLGSRAVTVPARRRAIVSVRLTAGAQRLLERRRSLAIVVARRGGRSGTAQVTPRRLRVHARSGS